MKREFRDVSGILLFDKPPGLSSNQALQKVRHLFRAQKAGHTGSLDPLATGLLPICFGEATKIAGYLLGARKAYMARCRLGATTTTDDAEGEVVDVRPVPAFDETTIRSVLATLRGRIVQIPPAYSAIKQGGVPLYKRARRGEEVDVPAREVEVFAFDLLACAGDVLELHVECGSGTYVRSLVRDLGAKLGCGAHLTALRREWVEPFRQPAMRTLAQLEHIHGERGPAGLDELLLPLGQGLAALPALSLSPPQAIALRQGKRLERTGMEAAPLCRALDGQGNLVALVEIGIDGGARVLRGFNAAATGQVIE
ncbi:MAG: tRNA pseudouridine(55) synthase TruB [Proteobacteria bacterium]|uniref:tRNA pseudouridine(55) synthase TruB n=1 Tax=Rudaea sp. TaxID=2136325 RepID=UPI00378398EE|nr:tRNA pseudouridine(55) synthase TruB [Pseudomonadota bacterium]